MLIKIFLFCSIILSVSAQNNLPFSKTYIQELETKLHQISTFEEEVLKRRNEIYTLSLNERLKVKDQNEEKAKKKALEDIENYDLVIDLIDQIKNESDLTIKLKKLKLAKDLSDALKVEGNLLFVYEAVEAARGILKKYAISKNKKELGVSKSLYNSKTGGYLDSEELEEKNLDTSDFEISPESEFMFRRDNISQVNVKESYLNGKNKLYEGHKVWWPSVNTFKLKRIKKAQSKPKLDVYSKNPETGEKELFKIKLGAEIHSEPTVAALANTIGIYTDLSKYIQNIKVYLDDMTFSEFRNDWYSYYDGYHLETLIKEKGQDEKGEYIIFIDGLIEQKLDNFKEYRRIGPWAWGSNDHKHLRETRGLFLFNVWVGNTDLKESENNKLIIKTSDKELKSFKIMHDMGFALGNFLREKPLDFKWKAVKKNKKNEIVLRFLNIQHNSGFDHVTYDDAKWMVRKIAMLTREQISDAVSIGGWPKLQDVNLHQLLVEKLISRRNDLVQAFELDQEKGVNLLSYDEILIENVPKVIEGYSVDFRPEVKDALKFPLKAMTNLIIAGANTAISSFNKIEIDPLEIGLDSGVITQALFNVKREIVKNPTPKSNNDMYIIKDKFLFGTRLGYGYVVSGDLALYREYTLIKTAPNLKQAKYDNNFIVNLSLPIDVLLKKLPDSHILIVSDFAEARGRIKISSGTGTIIDLGAIGSEATFSRIKLGRSIVSKKENKELIFYEDKSNFNRVAFKAFLQAGIIKMPFLSTTKDYGKISRSIYQISLDDKSDLSNKAIEAVISSQDFSLLKSVATEKKITSNFVEENTKINLLGLLGLKRHQRNDDIYYHGEENTLEDDRLVLQINKENEFFWNTFLSGESHSESVNFVTVKDIDHNIKEAALKLRYRHEDKRVKSKEFNENYLTFLNSVSKNENFIEFSPELHSSNQEYGHMEIGLDLDIYLSGLEKLSQLTINDLLSFATKATGIESKILYKELHKPLIRPTRFNNPGEITNRVFVFRGKSYLLSNYIRDLKILSRFIKEAKKKLLKNKDISTTFVNAFYKAIRYKDGNYNPLILNTVLQALSNKDYYLKAFAAPYEGLENKLPEKIIPFNSEGRKKKVKEIELLTEFEDMISIYQFFN